MGKEKKDKEKGGTTHPSTVSCKPGSSRQSGRLPEKKKKLKGLLGLRSVREDISTLVPCQVFVQPVLKKPSYGDAPVSMLS